MVMSWMSRSARTARIEIFARSFHASPAYSRGPQGPRGLKCDGHIAKDVPLASRSARTARIEIVSVPAELLESDVAVRKDRED